MSASMGVKRRVTGISVSNGGEFSHISTANTVLYGSKCAASTARMPRRQQRSNKVPGSAPLVSPRATGRRSWMQAIARVMSRSGRILGQPTALSTSPAAFRCKNCVMYDPPRFQSVIVASSVDHPIPQLVDDVGGFLAMLLGILLLRELRAALTKRPLPNCLTRYHK